jgi:hypothetical protein
MSNFHSDTHPEIAALQIELMRRLTPTQKLAMVTQLNHMVRTLALSGLKSRYPDDPPEKLRRRLADLILGADLACKVYGPLDDDN